MERYFGQTVHHKESCGTHCEMLLLKDFLNFFPQQSKMQTDQDEQPTQGEAQKETEEKTPRESEEMEVRCLCRIS